MPTFTVSATGGNWSNTATWVGGVLPAAGDDIVANASSGPLTVDSNRTCLTINFTNYTNVFTINDGVTLNVTGNAITLGSGMTYTQGTTGVLSTSSGNQSAITIAFAGITIPRLTIGKSSFPNTQTITISGTTPTVQNLTVSSGVAVTTTLSGSALTITSSITVSANQILAGSSAITINGNVTTSTSGSWNTGFIVTSSSSLTLSTNLRIGGGTVTFASGSTLTHNNFALRITVSNVVTLNTSNITWHNLTMEVSGTVLFSSNLNIGVGGITGPNDGVFLNGAFNVNCQGSITNITNVVLVNSTLNLTGTGNISVNSFVTGPVNIATGANYTIQGTALTLTTATFSLQGTASVSIANSNHTLTLNNSSVLSTNNTSTGANIVGGTEIQWRNLTVTFTNTITWETTVLGNLTQSSSTINGAKLLVFGNLSGNTQGGTNSSLIELVGSSSTTWSGIWGNSITLNKSSSATVTINGATTWGAAGRTLTIPSGNTLIMSNDLTMVAGTMTFSGTGSLIPNTNTLFLTGTGAKTLNTSTVNWWNVNNNTQTTLVQLLSNLNITNNLSFTNTFGSGGCGFSGNFNVNVGGSLFLNDLGVSSITFTGGGSINMIGTGTIRSTSTGTSVLGCTLNINTTNPLGYIFGDASFPILRLGSGGVLNLQGTSVASVYSPTGHTLHMTINSILNTNNTPTGANLPGGTEILWGNLTCTPTGNQTVTISQQTIFQGNLTTNVAGNIFSINGAKIIVYGNLSGIDIRGTSEIELGGSVNANWSTGSYQNNITINKSSGGVVNLSGTITWGAAGRTLQRTAGNINPGTSTISIPASTSVTIDNMVFWNLTLGTSVTVAQNALNTVQNTLTCSGTATFTGARGWTTNNFTCTTAASTITLQNINANPLAEYRITRLLTLIGTLASRITLQAAGFATFTGTINPVGQLNIASGTAPSIGMTISQATGISPNGLIGLLPNRPVITGGSNPTFTILPSATATLGSTSMRAGFKAKFILENNGVATQNVGYVTTQDIDSSDGQTIFSAGSDLDNVTGSTIISLFRTLNWNNLVASNGNASYTFNN